MRIALQYVRESKDCKWIEEQLWQSPAIAFLPHLMEQLKARHLQEQHIIRTAEWITELLRKTEAASKYIATGKDVFRNMKRIHKFSTIISEILGEIQPTPWFEGELNRMQLSERLTGILGSIQAWQKQRSTRGSVR